MIVDTHSHLNFKAYDEDRDQVLKRTREADIVCVAVGTKWETSQKAVELAEKQEGVFAAIGLHPIHLKQEGMKFRMDADEGGFTTAGEYFDEAKFLKLAQSPKVVAVGEVGLDYYYKPKTTGRLQIFKNIQKQAFVQQLQFAKKIGRPVIVHCRMAHADAVEVLRQQEMSRGVIHCFTGTVEEMKAYLDLGFHIGINGIIFKLALEEVVKHCPLDRMLLETDCPYLTPPMAPEKRNEPAFIKYTLERVTELKGVSIDEVTGKTTQNAKALFGI